MSAEEFPITVEHATGCYSCEECGQSVHLCPERYEEDALEKVWRVDGMRCCSRACAEKLRKYLIEEC